MRLSHFTLTALALATKASAGTILRHTTELEQHSNTKHASRDGIIPIEKTTANILDLNSPFTPNVNTRKEHNPGEHTLRPPPQATSFCGVNKEDELICKDVEWIIEYCLHGMKCDHDKVLNLLARTTDADPCSTIDPTGHNGPIHRECTNWHWRALECQKKAGESCGYYAGLYLLRDFHSIIDALRVP